MKTIFPSLVLFVILLFFVTVQSQTPEVTFKTPEATITHYLGGVAQHDLDQILQACAVNEMSENFEFDLSVENLGGFMNLSLSLAPNDHPFYLEINKMQITSQILNQVKNFSISLLSDEAMNGMPIFDVDAERVNKLINDITPERLVNLAVIQISLPSETIMSDPKYLERSARFANVYGANEQTERTVLFSFEQRYYFMGFTLLRYGENWKVSNQSSAIGNTSPLGTALETTLEEFETMIRR